MLTRTYTKYLVVISFILVFFSVAEKAQALTVSPAKLELSGNPGTTVKSEFQLFNEEPQTTTFYSSFANFEAQGESGSPSFVPAKEGLATWFKTPEQVILKSKEQKTVPFTIKIPESADPGGHFAAIFWGTVPAAGAAESQVSVGAKLGILVLLKVSGQTKEGGGILGFYAGNNQKIFASLPVKFIYRFQNSGNNRVKPAGDIKIKNILGQTSVDLAANPKEGNVLPQSVRKFEIIWGETTKEEPSSAPANLAEKTGFLQIAKKEWNNFAFGRYSAELNLKFGDKENKASYGFWIIPWQLLIIIIIVSLFVIILATKGVKRYNQWIIKKAREGNFRI